LKARIGEGGEGFHHCNACARSTHRKNYSFAAPISAPSPMVTVAKKSSLITLCLPGFEDFAA
jgi:hypothetical protein